jgi:hypothetical protein
MSSAFAMPCFALGHDRSSSGITLFFVSRARRARSSLLLRFGRKVYIDSFPFIFVESVLTMGEREC